MVALYATITILYVQTQFAYDYRDFARFFGLYGITSLFIAAIMSAFLRQIYKMFGVAFIKVHHLFAIAGLVLITLHPVSFSFFRGIQVFIPDFSSWYAFWSLAGRPALYVIYVAVAAVLLKKMLKKSWRAFHAFLYVALVFGVVHGTLLGEDFANPVIDGIYYTLLRILVVCFFYKHGSKITKKLYVQRVKEANEGNNAVP